MSATAPERTDIRVTTGRDPVTKPWAFSVFMKPDAALEPAAIADVEEMKKVRPTVTMHIGVQIERTNDVERLHIDEGEEVLHPSPDPRPGNLEADVQQFLAWANRTSPAQYQMVVLWGHSRGVGVDVTGPRSELAGLDDPQAVRPVGRLRLVDGARANAPAGPPPDALSVTQLTDLFAAPLPERANPDAAVRSSGPRQAVPRRKLDLLGFDSCYMSSVEFTCALRHTVNYVVASQSFIKTEGWNYRTVLNALASNPFIEPEAFGRKIVDHVVELQGASNLALVNLTKAEPFIDAFRELVDALLEAIRDRDERRALQIVLGQASFLQVRQFLDLRDLCHKIREEFAGRVADAAFAVLQHLQETAFLYHRARDRALGRLNGLSIYYPHVRAEPPMAGLPVTEGNAVVDLDEYRALEFVTRTHWLDLLSELAD